MRVHGTVEDGIGDASIWLKKYSDVYRSWTGMTIYPGSLNIRVDGRFDWNDPRISPEKRIHSLTPHGGNRDICLVPCRISAASGEWIAAFAWATTNAAEDPDHAVLEIIAPVRLRDALQLANGTAVAIEVPIPWSV